MPKIDRRAARTRGALGEALVRLTQRQGYDGVRVGDVCRAADVGRSTFYAHYADKDDLKRRAMGDHLRAVIVEATGDEGCPDPLGFALPLFRHARDHRELRRALGGTQGATIATEVLSEVVRDHVRSVLRLGDGPDPDQTPPEASAVFVAGAWMALCTWWLDRGAVRSPEEMDVLFRRLAGIGV